MEFRLFHRVVPWLLSSAMYCKYLTSAFMPSDGVGVGSTAVVVHMMTNEHSRNLGHSR